MSEQLELLKRALAESYAIERVVGRGGMATVYLAQDLKHNRSVALKLLRPELTLAVGTERFTREIRFAASLQHPHILPVYDSGEVSGMLYYVMPFVQGESVADRLSKDEGLPVPLALQIAADVAEALHYAHQRGVVHRDIKPGNIMLSGNSATITDFGIARALSGADDRLTYTGVAIGTPAYMSPEQAAGEGEIDGRSDLYSLGCVAYEMLTGTPPFTGSTAQATIAQRFTGVPPRLRDKRRDLSAAVESVIAKSLAKMPSDRYRTGAEFSAALSLAQSGEVLVRSRPRRRVLGGALAVIVLAVATAFWVSPAREYATVVPGADVIAVMPFNASGPAVQLLGEGMIDLLSANLDRVGGIRTVDPSSVLHRWRAHAASGPVDLTEALEVGREVGAGAVLRGSVVEAGPEVRITAELFTVAGHLLARVRADGPADSVLALVDNLSVRLLRDVWRSQEPMPEMRVSSITTASLDAIRDYLRGEQFYRRSQWDSAAVYFERAVADDSTFALAYFRLAHTFGWMEGHGSARAVAYLESGKRESTRLPERERALMEAHDLFEQGNVESVRRLYAYVSEHPSDAYGWFELADAQYHAQQVLGLTDGEIYSSFDSAINLVPTLIPALIHPTEMSLASGDRTRFERYVALVEAAGGGDEANRFRDIALAIWDSTDSGAAAMYRVARRQTTRIDLVIRAHFALARDDPSRIIDALDRALRDGVPDSTLTGMLILKTRFLSSLGRLREAREVLDTLIITDPAQAVLPAIYPVIAGFADPTFAEPGVRVLNQIVSNNSVVVFWKALFAAAMSDPAAARAVVDEYLLRMQVDSSEVDGLLTGILGWATLLEGDSVAGVEQIEESLALVGFAPGLSSFLGPLTFELGVIKSANPETRTEGVRRLQYGIGEEYEYQALRSLALAHALEEANDVQGAVAEYTRFIRLWSGADPQLQSAVAAAEDAVARLSGERSTRVPPSG